jgi:hypothetical protein
MESRLDEAVARTVAGQEGRRSIQVTRHGLGFFAVSLSDAVPFGLMLEHQAL